MLSTRRRQSQSRAQYRYGGQQQYASQKGGYGRSQDQEGYRGGSQRTRDISQKGQYGSSSQRYQQKEKGGNENIFEGRKAAILKLGRGANYYNVEKQIELFEQCGGEALTEDSFGDQDSSKVLRDLDYIIVWDHDLAIDPRKIAHEMNIDAQDLSNILDNVEVVSYMWINECADRGKMVSTKDFKMELDKSKIYRGGSGSKESYSKSGGYGKRRGYQSQGGYKQQRGRYKRGQYDDIDEENEYDYDLDEEDYENEDTAQTFRKRGGRQYRRDEDEEEGYQSHKYKYQRRYDPRHLDDPDAPGLQGSNFFVKKTPQGDIRRHNPEEATAGGGFGKLSRRKYSSRYNKLTGRQFDEEREEDPEAPGLRGSNYFVKKTPHGDIRRHYPEEEGEEEGRRGGSGQKQGRSTSQSARRSGGTLAHEMKMREGGRGEREEEEGTQESQRQRNRGGKDYSSSQRQRSGGSQQRSRSQGMRKQGGSGGGSGSLSKDELLDTLQKLADTFQDKKDTGHMVAYKRAITRVEDHEADINNLDDLDTIYGIGPIIKDQLKEYFQSGKIEGILEEEEGGRSGSQRQGGRRDGQSQQQQQENEEEEENQ